MKDVINSFKIADLHKINAIKLNKVIGVTQPDDYSCGAASYATVLNTKGVKVSIDQAKIESGTTLDGSSVTEIAKNLIKRKVKHSQVYLSNPDIDSIKREIDLGKILIILYQAWEDHPDQIKKLEVSHYSIICGYTKDSLILFDTWMKNEPGYEDKDYLIIKFDEFAKRWWKQTINGTNLDDLGMGHYWYLAVGL